MKPLSDAQFKFGRNIKTIFIDADKQRAETVYDFYTGPEATSKRINDPSAVNGVWNVKFKDSATVVFDRFPVRFGDATVIKNDEHYEMIITILHYDSHEGQLIQSVKSL